jgi:MYXO-CTERM domain-containing protein
MQTAPSSSPVSRPSSGVMPACACDRCERTRVRHHLLGAIEQILARPAITASASRSRAVVVAELVRYTVAGTFPRNEDPSRPLGPIFVDRIGTRCAVGHLLDRTGEAALVDDVARTANHAFVAELARDTRLQSSLARVGITEAEAARIQPCYSCPAWDPLPECACALPGLHALVVGVVVTDPETFGKTIVVEATYGEPVFAVGDVIRSWSENPDSYVGVHEGARLLLGVEAEDPQVLYEIDGGTVLTSACARNCGQEVEGVADVPLDLFIQVAEGEACGGVFRDQPGWAVHPAFSCPPPYSAADASATSTSSGDLGGGGSGEGGAGATPVATASDDGCRVAGGPADPTAALLWALAAGLALRRRRLGVRD